MAIEIRMPAMSPTMKEGTLSQWLVKEGDVVASGDILAEIETDKATMELEADSDGILGKILIPEGSENIPVDTLIAVLLEEGEDFDKLKFAEPALKQSQNGADKSKMAPKRSKQTSGIKSLTVREALRDAMAEEMRRDDTVFLIGEEVAEYQGAYKVSQGLLDEFGAQRVIDTPITEAGFAGLGVGAAMAGLKPIVEFMTFNFAMQAMDQLVNSAAKTHYMSGGKLNCPIVFRGPNGAAARVGAQHSQCYASWYGHIPGFKVIAPYTAADAKGLLKAAIRDPNPVIFLENEILYGRHSEVDDDDELVVPIGKARIAREGRDVTLIGYSISVEVALAAAEALANQGIEAEVIDLRTIRPLDVETIVRSIKKTNRAVTVEEAFPFCGIGSEIVAQIMEHAFDYLDAPVLRVTNADVPMPYAADLESAAVVHPDQVVKAAQTICYRDQDGKGGR